MSEYSTSTAFLVLESCVDAGQNVEDHWFQQSKNAVSYSIELSKTLNAREMQQSANDDWTSFSAKTTGAYFEKLSRGAAIDVGEISSEAVALVEATKRESVGTEG